MEKSWFEFTDLKAKDPLRQVWTPVWQSKTKTIEGTRNFDGYCSETTVSRAFAFPVKNMTEALNIHWSKAVKGGSCRPYIEDGQFFAADVEAFWDKDFFGTRICVEQSFDCDPRILYLSQDLILFLDLKQIDETWVRPVEDDFLVAKIVRDQDNNLQELTIRTEYLRDYLCAREMGLVSFAFSSRTEHSNNNPNFWVERQYSQEGYWRWDGDTRQIVEGSGYPKGEKMLVIHMTRQNTDYNEDIPYLKDKDDKNIKSESFEKTFDGSTLFETEGNIWINTWLPPGEKSPICRRDEVNSSSMFYIDAAGNKVSGDDLRHTESWLWFRPDLIPEILKQKRASLTWFTQDTGAIYFDKVTYLHFGQNDNNLINILCEDVGLLDEFRKEKLVSFNVKPDGGVSKELLMAQKTVLRLRRCHQKSS